MPSHSLHPPDPTDLLGTIAGDKPLGIILAGHNGSGKSTLWYLKLADVLQIPLVNADRLTLSILPPLTGDPPALPGWAAKLRDEDARWQWLSQQGVKLYMELIKGKGIPFAFETVFSYLVKHQDGTFQSKQELIDDLQRTGYAVALLFVGLASVDLSILRVGTRRAQGGHDVPPEKLIGRFPRTQEAIRLAAPIADMTLMFDNSRSVEKAFTLARVQTGNKLVYDCRDRKYGEEDSLVDVASIWLDKVAPR
jgi:predicted ABC-type ATPase